MYTHIYSKKGLGGGIVERQSNSFVSSKISQVSQIIVTNERPHDRVIMKRKRQFLYVRKY